MNVYVLIFWIGMRRIGCGSGQGVMLFGGVLGSQASRRARGDAEVCDPSPRRVGQVRPREQGARTTSEVTAGVTGELPGSWLSTVRGAAHPPAVLLDQTGSSSSHWAVETEAGSGSGCLDDPYAHSHHPAPEAAAQGHWSPHRPLCL